MTNGKYQHIIKIGTQCAHCGLHWNQQDMARVIVIGRRAKEQVWCHLCRRYTPKHIWHYAEGEVHK